MLTPMHIFKRGKVYWYEFVYAGVRYRRSSKLKNANAARDMASALRTALVKGEVGITERTPAPRFGAAMKNFLAWSEEEHRAHPKTAERYRWSSAALLRWFGDTPLDRITADDVEQFKVSRAGEEVRTRRKAPTNSRADRKPSTTSRKVRPATVNRELACLRALFNHASKADPKLQNPVRRVKFLAEQNQQERVLTFAEQRIYLEKAAPTLRDVAYLILETGLRPDEVFTLRRQDVNLEAGYLQVPRGKTAAARRRVYLTKAAVSIVAARVSQEAESPFLFPHGKDPNRPLPNVHSAHHRALAESKLKPFRLYDCRHTWATRAAEAGIDPVTLAAMLGHSRIQMVLRYAHPQQGHQNSAMQRLEMLNAAREIAEAAAAKLQ